MTATDVARLHSRIYLHFLGVLLVVGVTTAVVFALGARDAFRREMALRMTHHLASVSGERLRDPAALAMRLREIHDTLHIDVCVRDIGGAVIAAGGGELPRLAPEEEADLRAGATVRRHHPMGFTAVPSATLRPALSWDSWRPRRRARSARPRSGGPPSW